MKNAFHRLFFPLVLAAVACGCATETTRSRSGGLLRDPIEDGTGSFGVVVPVHPDGTATLFGERMDREKLASRLRESVGGVNGKSVEQDHMVQLEAQPGVGIDELEDLRRFLARKGIARVAIVTARRFDFEGEWEPADNFVPARR